MKGRNDLTINRRIAESAKKNPDKPALTSKAGKEWKPITFSQLEEEVRRLSLGLRALGIVRGDRVAIISENRPQWAIADLATLAAGAVSVPVYPSLPASQVAYILADSGAKAVVVSDAKQLLKAQAAKETCPNLSIFIAMGEDAAQDGVLSFTQVQQKGDDAPKPSPSYKALRESVRPDDLASLIYTSGTTGDPKGAMLTHGNLASATAMVEKALPFRNFQDVFLSFLPLCHVFERVTYYLALTVGANTCYTESLFKVQENMTEVHPTLMQSVPRLYESIYERVLDQVAKQPKRRQKIFHWALRVGKHRSRRKNAGRFVGPFLGLKYRIADKLVLSKIRARFGGKLRFFASGGAPLSVEVAEFFNAIGIPVLEGYGLTETCAALCVNRYGRARVGTVGKPIPGVEIRIAPDGEILAKGANVMSGYWNKPDATAEVIDSKGWFHTGDIGEFDKGGYLKITDRKKDIIVLTNGKNVAPQPIETKLKAADLISEVILLGDRADTISALVVPNFDKLAAWAKAQNIAFEDPKELTQSVMAKKEIKAQIDTLSKELAEFEKDRKIALLDHPLSIENGELTPTLKVRRKIVRERYGHLLE